jgi:hypothetical protein
MGEDPWSRGEWASRRSQAEAEAHAGANGIDLYAKNPDRSVYGGGRC